MAARLPFVPSSPSIDPVETAWVAQELAALACRLDPQSPAGAVLLQARRELASLLQAAPAVAKPRPRLKVAA